MKRIFTLLFCALALGFAANANDNALINRCIDTVLGNIPAEMTLTAPNIDANNDGEINITDVTTLINESLQSMPQANRAPFRNANVELLIEKTLNNEAQDPNISSVTKAIGEDQVK